MQENNAGPRRQDNATIDQLEIAPSYATDNMVVTIGSVNYLVAWAQPNLIRALILAHTMSKSISFTTTGDISGEGYGYIGSVTI